MKISKKLIPLVIIFVLLLVGCNNSKKEPEVELTISAAASLKEAMADINSEFTKKYPNIKLTFNFGSSGSLQQQIENGAPSDLFISAGQSQMDTLDKKDLLLKNSKKDLLRNTLVLVGPINTTITSINDLIDSSITHIAIGEPNSVPAGKYAEEVLRNSELMEKISHKLVFAKDVKEVLAWVSSNNAEVGFIYGSDALSSSSVKVIEPISKNLHSPIIYPIGIIKDSKNIKTAQLFEDFLYTDTCQKVFEKYGYEPISTN